MKKVFSYAFTLWLCISVLLGCRKETLHADLKTEAVKKIKDAYESGKKLQTPSYSNIGGHQFLVGEEPLWEEAFYSEADPMVIVPIKIIIGDMEGSIQLFLVGKSNGNNKEFQINKYRILLPNYDGKYKTTEDINKVFLAIHANAILSAFSGLIQKYSVTGVLLSEYKYDNGSKIKLSDKESVDSENYTGPIRSNAPLECSSYIVDSWWVTYLDGEPIAIELEYSTTYTNCNQQGGSGNSSGNTNTSEVVGTIHDSFLYTCPSSFSFGSVTTNNLWQEAGISNAYCNLVYHNFRTGQTLYRTITVPIMYFGMPYFNVNGGVVNTMNSAKIKAANAFNYGEAKMNKFFKNNPMATDIQLQQKWIQEAENDLKAHTSGAGRVSIFPSINPQNPAPVNPYSPCQ